LPSHFSLCALSILNQAGAGILTHIYYKKSSHNPMKNSEFAIKYKRCNCNYLICSN
jgi:hypothetical protein